MAIGIGGERNIDHMKREHFDRAAADAGLSKKMALKHFDALALINDILDLSQIGRAHV